MGYAEMMHRSILSQKLYFFNLGNQVIEQVALKLKPEVSGRN